jgi:membrane protease YdiL (CAAX protease family)
VVFLLGVVFEMMTSNTQLQSLSFDSNSMLLALQISGFMLIGGIMFDQTPNKVIQNIVRDTRVYTLRIIGRNSDPFSAFGVALLLSLAAGLSEELLFRGFLQMWIREWAGPQIAIL